MPIRGEIFRHSPSLEDERLPDYGLLGDADVGIVKDPKAQEAYSFLPNYFVSVILDIFNTSSIGLCH